MSMRTEEPPPPASTAGSKTPGGASAGRGVAFLSLSKGWFMVAGYAGVFGLTRLLPKRFRASPPGIRRARSPSNGRRSGFSASSGGASSPPTTSSLP